MAHFDYIKPGGVWSLLSLLSSAIMAEIDRRIYKSINGDEGGVWAPTPTPIIIGGLGLQVTGPFTASNANITIKTGKFLTVESGGTVNLLSGSIVNLAGTTTISGPLSITSGTVVESAGNIELIGGSFTISSPTSFSIDAATTLNATITVSGGAGIGVANTGNITWQSGALANYNSGSTTTFALGSTLNSNGALTQGTTAVWTLNGTSNFGAASVISCATGATTTFNNTPSFVGGASVGGVFTRSTTYQENLRFLEAANGNIFVDSFRDVIKIPATLGTDKTYSLGDPTISSSECRIKHFYRAGGGSAQAVIAYVGGTIATLKNSVNPKSVTLVFEGSTGSWQVLAYSGVIGTDLSIP